MRLVETAEKKPHRFGGKQIHIYSHTSLIADASGAFPNWRETIGFYSIFSPPRLPHKPHFQPQTPRQNHYTNQSITFFLNGKGNATQLIPIFTLITLTRSHLSPPLLIAAVAVAALLVLARVSAVLVARVVG